MTPEGPLANPWMLKTMAEKMNTTSGKENLLSTMIKIRGEDILKVALQYALIFELLSVYKCPLV
jgi:hypothetical protein